MSGEVEHDKNDSATQGMFRDFSGLLNQDQAILGQLHLMQHSSGVESSVLITRTIAKDDSSVIENSCATSLSEDNTLEEYTWRENELDQVHSPFAFSIESNDQVLAAHEDISTFLSRLSIQTSNTKDLDCENSEGEIDHKLILPTLVRRKEEKSFVSKESYDPLSTTNNQGYMDCSFSVAESQTLVPGCKERQRLESYERMHAKGITPNICREMGFDSSDFYIHREGSLMCSNVEPSSLKVSDCFHTTKQDLENAVDMLRSYIDCYVVLPAFTYRFDEEKISDFQLFLTGGLLSEESKITASKRKIAEEIGVYVNINDVIFQEHRKVSKSNRINHIVIYKSSRIKQINPDFFPAPSDSPIKSRKILSWLIVDQPEQVVVRERLQSRDRGGKFVVMTRVENLIRLLNYIL